MGARRAMSALDEHCTQRLVAPPSTGGAEFAGAAVIARTHAGPCGEALGAGEHVEVLAEAKKPLSQAHIRKSAAARNATVSATLQGLASVDSRSGPVANPGFGARMTSGAFAAGDWIERLARALPGLAEAQEHYLSGYREIRLLSHLASGVHADSPLDFPLGDVRELYARARHSHRLGEQEHYAALCAVLDPVRHILIGHPTLARIVGPLIGRDYFYMGILNCGGSTSPTDLIAGLMTRAAEFSGDRYRKAAGELHAFFSPAREEDSAALSDGLDVGYDAVLFHGLSVKERSGIGESMALPPFERVRTLVDEELVYELAPPGTGFHGNRSVGALARMYRWRPAFYRAGYERELASHNPLPFLRQAQIFLELLAVAHATPVLRLADLSHRIDLSAGRLLGLERHDGGCHRGRSA